MTNYNFQPKGYKSKQGWYFRNLPHFDGGETLQFLTARLFDSLPQKVLKKWREKLERDKNKIAFRKKIEQFLDSGYRECLLGQPEIAAMVQDSLLFHNNSKYKLFAWVVMPNHIHFLVRPFENIELEEITHSVKSYTAHEANKLLERQGSFWQEETFDRYIRNRKHYVNVIKYIENNPVKAGLCEKKEDWKYSSAYLKANGIKF